MFRKRCLFYSLLALIHLTTLLYATAESIYDHEFEEPPIGYLEIKDIINGMIIVTARCVLATQVLDAIADKGDIKRELSRRKN